MLGKGLDPSAAALVFCIILILVGIWMTYFDNQPHGHYGTIRQQVWSTLHFPLHLSIVGVVEGAQQVALARYVLKSDIKLSTMLTDFCFQENLVGDGLITALNETLDYYQFIDKPEAHSWHYTILDTLHGIAESPNICSNATGSTVNDLPDSLQRFGAGIVSGIYASLGYKLKFDKYIDALGVAKESWKIVYRYFWSANAILFGTFIIFTILIRRNKTDFFDFTSRLSRGFAFVAAAVFIAISSNIDMVISILSKPWVLPVAIFLLYMIIILDRFGRWVANRRNRKSREPLIEDHVHGHGNHGHGTAVGHTTGATTSATVTHGAIMGWPEPQHHATAPATAIQSSSPRPPVQYASHRGGQTRYHQVPQAPVGYSAYTQQAPYD